MNHIKFLILFLFISLITKGASDDIGVPLELGGILNPVSVEISFDGTRMLIIDHPNKGERQLYESTYNKSSKTWSTPSPLMHINSLLTGSKMINAPFFGYNMNRFYFAAELRDGLGGTDIYYCDWENDKWSAPKNMGPIINTSGNEDSPSLSATHREFYFIRISNEAIEDNLHGGEIWETSLNLNDEWIEPVLLNNTINSSFIRSFRVLEDNKTFLYSMYDKDEKWELFWTKKLMNNNWYFPLPITIVNTDEREYSPAYNRLENKLYYIENRAKDTKPKNTLLTCDFPGSFAPQKTIWVSGQIIDKNTESPVSMKIEITRSLTSELIAFATSSELDGKWKLLLPARDNYSFELQKKGYSYAKEQLTDQQSVNDTLIVTRLFSKAYMKLNVYDSETLIPLSTELKLYNQSGEQIAAKNEKAFDGHTIIEVPLGEKYYIKAFADNFHSDSVEIDLTHLLIFNQFERDMELIPIKKEFVIDVADADSGIPLEVEVVIRDKETNEEYVATVKPNSEGKYVVQLRQGGEYEVNIKGPKGYSFFNDQVNLEDEKKSFQMKVNLTPLKAKTKIQLKNIQFEHNSADLQESSFAELDRVVSLMIDNPMIKIEISAHTDDKGSDNYNNKLSNKRAYSVVNYLINKGVIINRLVAKGYGESSPLVENSSDENRALNRRVELKVIDIEEEKE